MLLELCILAVGALEQNDKKGLEYIIKAANQSHLKAQYTLGAMYYLGIGVPLDFERLSVGLVYLRIRAILMHNTTWPKCMRMERV